MIKSELIHLIALQMPHLPLKRVAQIVDHILSTMTESLAEGRRIEIRGFGSFAIHDYPPRNARNPKTGEKIVTKARRIPHFKAGKPLKNRLNSSS